jgi:hypothetical protein
MGWPQYTLAIPGWETGAEVAADGFKSEVPAGVKKLMRGKASENTREFLGKGRKVIMAKR